tara:strand:+ start:5928 stop:6920 length:993 start_codon:yes stop_codon:yes gene_type:complete
MFLFLLVISLNILIYIFSNDLAKFLKVYDTPDKVRKFHKIKIPLIGGIIILFNSILALYLIFMNQLNFEKSFNFKSNFDLLILLISIFIFFLIGFVDDKYNVSANKRFIFISIILLPIILFSDDLIIKVIEISFMENSYSLTFTLSIFWTVLCFLLFINAFNMFDGINYQVGCYSIYISFFFLINNYFSTFFLLILIGLITFIFLNHKNKSFLGDSGSYLLAFIFGYFFVKLYNQVDNVKADHIVLFMIIPGVDLIRLFIVRIVKGKNPFTPDRNHLHHILADKFNLIKTNLIIQSLIVIPSILGFYYGFTYIYLLIQITIYFYLIIFLK